MPDKKKSPTQGDEPKRTVYIGETERTIGGKFPGDDGYRRAEAAARDSAA